MYFPFRNFSYLHQILNTAELEHPTSFATFRVGLLSQISFIIVVIVSVYNFFSILVEMAETLLLLPFN